MIIKQRFGDAPGAHLANFPPLLQHIYAARAITDPQQLDYSLGNLLPPASLAQIEIATDLLVEAMQADASILVVGDFDADGATSCALALKCLRAFGLRQVNYLVPNRFEFGYGLSPELVGVAAAYQPDIIITVDNGVSSIDGVHAAQALGMSVIVTDHHLPGEAWPTAEAIVNPNMPQDEFPSKNLAGVGVIFYVMLALRTRLRKTGWFEQVGISEPNMGQFLDLVALGTVADVVPLDLNNRILVQQGLQLIRRGGACVGVQALLQVASRDAQNVKAADLGFAIGPRLNAAGRLQDMSIGIECLLADDMNHALKLAETLHELNQQRKNIETDMREQAMAQVENIQLNEDSATHIYVLDNADWHHGLVGLIAGRVKERYHRPVIALAPTDTVGEWKGSARSISGLHIRDLLARVDALYPKLIVRYGGHAMAAGLTIQQDSIPAFRQAIETTAAQMMRELDLEPIIWVDGRLQETEFTLEFVEQLQLGSPWGQGFPEPVFHDEFHLLEARTVGDTHLKMRLQPLGGQLQLDAIYFGYFDTHQQPPATATIELVFQLDINEWQGRRSVQLLGKHLCEPKSNGISANS